MAAKHKDLLALIYEQLKQQGIDLDALCADWDEDSLCGDWGEDAPVKVVCVAPDLKDSVEALNKGRRDQVVMVRIDEETSKSLDDWVESGAVRSRSEGAALFIREGLKVRADELEKLNEALEDVKAARERLRREAQRVFGREN